MPMLHPMSFIAMTTTDINIYVYILILKKKKSRWLKIESSHETVMSAHLLWGLLNARCAVPDARVSGRCFPPVSWFFSAELQRSVHSALLLCVGDEVTAWCGAEAHNASLFAFCYCTVKWVVLAWVLVTLLKTQRLVIIGEAKHDFQHGFSN